MNRRKTLIFGLAHAFIALSVIVISGATGASAAPEATFDVDSFTDAVDADIGNGTCNTVGGVCTLRAAIQEANQLGSTSHTINLPAGVYTLTIAGTGEDIAATGDLDINTNLIISGAGADTTIIDGDQLDRVFHVASGSSVTLQNISIRNGQAPAGEGSGGDDGGGGILNAGGTLNLSNCVLENNQALGDTEQESYGGAIDSLGSLTISNSLFQFNTADHGGAIYSTSGVTIEIRKSLIYSNTATTAEGSGGGLDTNGTAIIKNATFSDNASSDGGAMYNAGSLDLNNVTIADNQSGISHNGTSLKINNTILANNTEWNCDGNSLTSLGHNIDSGTTCGLADGTDKSSSDPKLESLADNGGPTQTYALQVGSPALEAGEAATCQAVDQRSESRPLDGNGDGYAVCDIGAFESATLPGYSHIYLPLVLR